MCKDQFVDIYKSLLVSYKLKEARDFCRDNIRDILPKKLYKYTFIENYSIENLKNNQLYLNNPREFNDPFDCWLPKTQSHSKYSSAIDDGFTNILKDISMTESMKEEFKKSVTDLKSSDQNDLYSTFNDLIDKRTRVVCFSEIPPTEIIMWSHYGNYHKGMCLEYDFSKCEDGCDIYDIINPVIYSELPLIIEHNTNIEYYACIALLSALYKSHEWKREEEWRFVKHIQPTDEGYKQLVPVQCLKHIYIGACVSEHGKNEKQNDYDKRLELRTNIINFAHKNDIDISEMERKNDSYLLHQKRLYP